MKRASFSAGLYLILYFFFISSGESFARISKRKKPIVDSIRINADRRLSTKVIQFSEAYFEKYGSKKIKSTGEFSYVLQSYGDALRRSGKTKEAEAILLESLERRRFIFGETDSSVANSLFSLGNLYNVSGDFLKAESNYLKALEIRTLVFGKYHNNVAASCHSLGSFLARIGRFSEAEDYYSRSIEIGKKNNGDEHSSLADSYNGLGVFYNETGNYSKAEIYLQKAINIWKKDYGEKHINLAYPFNNIGNLFERLGNYSAAEMYMNKSLDIYLRHFGENHSDVADLYHNLGVLYLEKKEYKKAEYYFLRSMDIKIKISNVQGMEMASLYLNIGNFYYLIGSPQKAEVNYLKSLQLYLDFLGDVHPEIANVYNNLASVYSKLENYQKSEEFYSKALKIYQKTLGESHSSLATTYSRLGLLNMAFGNLEKAELNYLNFQKREQDMLKRYFPFLSDAEKEKYFETEKPYINVFKTFCVLRYTGNPLISQNLYNHQLATKAVLLNSSSKWRQRVKTSGNPELTKLFEVWNENRNRLNKLEQSTDSIERLGTDSIQNKTEQLEKRLSLISENFLKLAEKQDVTWREVQAKLNKGEAAIEIIRIQNFGVSETIVDTSDALKNEYKIKALTDTISYVALIVKKESEYPDLVVLKNGNELESKCVGYYKKCIQKRTLDTESYAHFWEKIARRLKGISKVYISPDGVYHKINLNTLKNPQSKKYLLDELEIKMVTVTKDLIQEENLEMNRNEVVMFGSPSYYRSSSDSSATRNKGQDFGNPNSGFVLTDLPATKNEIKLVSKILNENAWPVSDFIGERASEENLKSIFKPIVLHIATHGFFKARDTNTTTDPLFRSGLMLANGGKTLKGMKLSNEDDGILTSAEAMNLNLDNTELVVLSACETGLGEVKNGEGVYGLQRAFKVAGAKSIIMSLWKVSDEATQELMVSFYKHWLKPQTGPLNPPTCPPRRKGDLKTPNRKISGNKEAESPLRRLGATKRSAFLKAQKELKAKYPDPFYWGAFVMLGN